MLIVTSYWSGVLPDITRLHFESFRNLNPQTQYVLYLDSDIGFEGVIPEGMTDLLDRLSISVRYISLSNQMYASNLPSFSKWKNSFFYRLSRRVVTFCHSYLLLILIKVLRKTELNFARGFHSPVMGYSPGHARAFSGSQLNLAERSDLFRSCIFSNWPDHDFLYVDLDICFLKPLVLNGYEFGAISQWGTADFGNSAFLFLPKSALKARSEILRELQNGTSALPWVLYNRRRCINYGLAILPNSLTDPAWTPGSHIHGESEKFFKSGPHVADFLLELQQNNLFVHWHNQWRSTPEKDSPYEILLSSFQN